MPSRTRALFRLSGPVKLLGGCLTHMKIPNTKCGKKKKWPSVDLGVKVEECWSCARRVGQGLAAEFCLPNEITV